MKTDICIKSEEAPKKKPYCKTKMKSLSPTYTK